MKITSSANRKKWSSTKVRIQNSYRRIRLKIRHESTKLRIRAVLLARVDSPTIILITFRRFPSRSTRGILVLHPHTNNRNLRNSRTRLFPKPSWTFCPQMLLRNDLPPPLAYKSQRFVRIDLMLRVLLTDLRTRSHPKLVKRRAWLHILQTRPSRDSTVLPICCSSAPKPKRAILKTMALSSHQVDSLPKMWKEQDWIPIRKPILF